jgi:aminoglycoside 6'-N-acetyltransferase
MMDGELCRLRPVREADVDVIVAIQGEPSVARWWGLPDRDHIAGKTAVQDGTVSFVIDRGGEVAGLIEYLEETEPGFRHASIDLFVATAHQRQGVGSDALRTLARHLLHDRGHHRLTIDPAVANTAAIRAYERLGFRPVGVMRQYWRDLDGVWQDGLLMDLLADELR